MRTYESFYIVHPEVVGDDLDTLIGKFKQILVDLGADVLKVDNWGTRTLAYPVKKQGKGTYILSIFDAPSAAISEYERRMRIDEKVIKFQTVILEGGYKAPEVQEAPAVAEAPVEETDAAEEAEEA